MREREGIKRLTTVTVISELISMWLDVEYVDTRIVSAAACRLRDILSVINNYQL